MLMRNILLTCVILSALVGLMACAPRTLSATPTLTASIQTTLSATSTPRPTDIPPTATPLPTPTLIAEEYFTESFDAALNGNWSTFILNGDENQMTLGVREGKFYFDLQAKAQWAYVIYQPRVYKDVKLEAVAANEGRNSNSVSLVCRYSEKGWYEFNIANDGLYNILACTRTSPISADCQFIIEGGSVAIRQGKMTNQYTATCAGDVLTLAINGQRVNSVRDRFDRFAQGQVGFSASSFEYVPVVVGFDSFQVSAP